MTPTRVPVRVAGIVVAYNDANRLRLAVTSLSSQRLEPPDEWSSIWVVVSPSDDGTGDVADELARRDPRVKVVHEVDRRGKSAAVADALQRAEGDFIVLLNGDAWAEPGSVAALLEVSRCLPSRFAVMARPCPAGSSATSLDSVIELLWELHHDFHLETVGSGSGNHVADEMLMVSGIERPPLRAGINSDGSFIAAWVRSGGGTLAYVPSARVRITTADSLRGFLSQRRRNHAAHRQIADLTGRYPSTLSRQAITALGGTVRTLVRRARHTPRGWRLLALLMMAETAGWILAAWDLALPAPQPAVWDRIRGRPWTVAATSPAEDSGV